VLAATTVVAALCFLQILKWISRSHVWDFLSSNSWAVPHPDDCVGSKCFEVFSCYGMKSATEHVREPLVTVSGAIVLPIGAIGAHHGRRWNLQVVGYYLTALTALHFFLIAGDLLYVWTCEMYPTNIIDETMVAWFPPSPVTNGAQGVLRGMSQYPFDAVAKLTHNFPVMKWYLAVTGSVLLFFAYTAREASLLGLLAERGPIGLGPCYGLGQWDQVLDYEAIKRIQGREVKSQFVEDCQPDEYTRVLHRIGDNTRRLDVNDPTFAIPGANYGAASNAPMFRAAGVDEDGGVGVQGTEA